MNLHTSISFYRLFRVGRCDWRMFRVGNGNSWVTSIFSSPLNYMRALGSHLILIDFLKHVNPDAGTEKCRRIFPKVLSSLAWTEVRSCWYLCSWKGGHFRLKNVNLDSVDCLEALSIERHWFSKHSFGPSFFQDSRYGFKLLDSSFLLGNILTLFLGSVCAVPWCSYRQEQVGCITRRPS